jgi:hypothetical protein
MANIFIKVPNYKYTSKLINKDIVFFNLVDLNIKIPTKFISSYNNLKKDNYVINNLNTNRFRKFRNYKIYVKNRNDNSPFEIHLLNNNYFKQNVPDNRGNIRKYEIIDDTFCQSDWMLQLITNFCEISLYNKCKQDKCFYNSICADISLHQVRQLCKVNNKSFNSPEGIHKDGADWIVSALVLNKINTKGGKSNIYDKTKLKMYSKNLNINEGIFMNDTNYYHDVTPIECLDNNFIGIRDILGIDIKFTDFDIK